MTNDDLKTILGRPGYGIHQGTRKGIPNAIPRAISSKAGGEGKVPHLEPAALDESLRAEAVSLNYTGKCCVRIKFFRKRLADYSRAISEKAIIDSLVYGGALSGDSEKEILLIDEGQFKVEAEAEERTEVVLEYPDFDFEKPFVPRTKFGNASL